MVIWHDGRLVEADGATVSVFDAGIQHAVGLFETMLARHGRIFRADRHLARLVGSAEALGLTERLRREPLGSALRSTLAANRLESARVRLTITGGNLHGLQSSGQRVVDPTIFIVAQPPTEYPEAFFEQGVAVTIADARANPFEPSAGHKTLSYWPRIRALQVAASRQAGEAIWFTVSNHLAGGSVSNAFLVHDGGLLTPIARGEEERGALPAPVLPGITREAIIEIAGPLGVAVERRMLDIEDLLASDEVFMTNSSWGVLPVVRVERERIGNGEVGALTRRVREAWNELVEAETGGPER